MTRQTEKTRDPFVYRGSKPRLGADAARHKWRMPGVLQDASPQAPSADFSRRTKVALVFSLSVVLTLSLARPSALTAQDPVSSPNGRNPVALQFHDGRLYYSLTRDGRPLLLPSMMGFAFKDGPQLRDSLRITYAARATHDETWTQPWGEVARVREHY